MRYSQFMDILPDVQRMEAEVIIIETSRSDMKLLDAFTQFNYSNNLCIIMHGSVFDRCS